MHLEAIGHCRSVRPRGAVCTPRERWGAEEAARGRGCGVVKTVFSEGV